MHLKKPLFTTIVTAAVALAMTLALSTSANAGEPTDKPDYATDLGAPAVAADASVQDAAVDAALDAKSTTVQKRIVAYVRAHGTSSTFGAYSDPATGRVILETDASDAVVNSLISDVRSSVTVRRANVSDSFSRKNDVSPFWGGAGIVLTKNVARCSSGYTVKNAAGKRFLVTAGHCFTNGQTVRTELGGVVVGTVSGRSLPSRDMELIGGKSYAPYIYIGGVNSSTGAHIASAADPVVGFTNYCHSGRTTGAHCGHKVTSVSATVCTSSGCKSPVIAFTGGVLPQGGDSGSPFYVGSVSGTNKHIRGHIIAIGGSTAYAEKWSRVKARYGVTIVT